MFTVDESVKGYDFIAVLSCGDVKSWNDWRKSHPNEFPCLDGIVLDGIDLTGVDLSKLSINNANITQCCLRSAKLISTQLAGADLRTLFLKKQTLRQPK